MSDSINNRRPPYNPTILETGAASAKIPATILEGREVRPVSDTSALPDEAFSDFVAEKRLSTDSTQAEILLVRHPLTGEQRVVKWYYNQSMEPRQDVLQQLLTLEARHVPRLFLWNRTRNG